MNKVVLIGNLTHDPEMVVTNSGIPVCHFSLAITRRYSNSEGVRETDFIPIVVWRSQAESCHKYLRKGSKAAVSGSLQIRNYETKTGEKRLVAEVVADEVEFVGARMAADGDDSELKPANDEDKNIVLEPVDDGDLPF
ncbi:MAG: single-stranded DNA-binding protein [Clostridia bacterium]|nr:single-stranded DNA-binding protein [Clostridia bacterium]